MHTQPALIAAALGLAMAAWSCGDDPFAATQASTADASADALDASVFGQSDGGAPLVSLPGPADAGDAQAETAADATPAVDATPAADAVASPTSAPATIFGPRPAAVTVPKQWASKDKWPLVVLLHGFSATGWQQDWYLGLSARVDKHGFVAVVPEGTKNAAGLQFWNATKACCNFANQPVDDVAYIEALIDEAVAKLKVDPARVYLYGHSNGAFMALRFACERSAKVTAVLSLAGATDIDPTWCKNALPVHVLFVHGTLDNVIPFNGGVNLGNPFPGVKTSAANWVGYNGCPSKGEKLPDVNFEDILIGNETQRTRWGPCQKGTQVELWQVNGALHVPIWNDAYRDAAIAYLLERTRGL
ncbi:MAG: alpha/beta fold hydrolase [Deltaproteobacteria bacterium]|nr:alpha/beta fold hydrolase [Deltaproteobacteria bacterium]